MSDQPTVDFDQLQERVLRLEAENARLREPAARNAERRSGRWRAVLSAICIVLASILVPVTIVGVWARVQLVNEDAFVATLAPLASDPAVQDMIVDETMQAIGDQVDFAQITGNVIDGISSLDLPPAAVTALGLLKQPAADGLESVVTTAVTRVVESDAFADVWATATRAAHRALTAAATSDGGGLVVMTDDGVGIQLGAIVERVKQNLVDRGIGAAELIPAVDRVVIIGSGTALVSIRTTYAVAAAVGWVLPLVTLALYGIGILLARRRSVAVLGTGIGLAIGAGALAIGFSIGAVAVGSAAMSLDLSPEALEVIYARLVDAMSDTAVVVALLGVIVAVLAWVQGRSRPAAATRAGFASANAGLRRALRRRGVDTGPFGAWMHRQRVLVRTLLALLLIGWLLLLRPLSVGEVFLVVVVGLVVWWLAELVQRRPEEAEPVAADATAQDAQDAATETTDAAASSAADVATSTADTAAIEPATPDPADSIAPPVTLSETAEPGELPPAPKAAAKPRAKAAPRAKATPRATTAEAGASTPPPEDS